MRKMAIHTLTIRVFDISHATGSLRLARPNTLRILRCIFAIGAGTALAALFMLCVVLLPIVVAFAWGAAPLTFQGVPSAAGDALLHADLVFAFHEDVFDFCFKERGLRESVQLFVGPLQDMEARLDQKATFVVESSLLCLKVRFVTKGSVVGVRFSC